MQDPNGSDRAAAVQGPVMWHPMLAKSLALKERVIHTPTWRRETELQGYALA